MVNLTIDNCSQQQAIPSQADFETWCQACLTEDSELLIRVVDDEESARLNLQFRQKNKPTNVLSFEENSIPGFPAETLGTLVMCAPLIVQEAQEQNISADAHWAHLCVHGLLHLQGHDHEDDTSAKQMEQKEIEILNQLGFENPYQSEQELP